MASSLIDYENEYYLMMSYDGIKEQLFGEKVEIQPILSRNVKQKKIKQKIDTVSLAQYKDDPNVICAIQSDSTLISLLTSYRKQKVPLAYIYIDNTQYVTFIIKVISYYPMIFAKFPVNEFSVYINPNAQEACYEFPINKLTIKQAKHKNIQYQIVLYNGDSLSLDFISIANNVPCKTSITNINPVSKSTIGALLSIESFESIGKGLSSLPSEPILEFNTSLVMMINQVKDISSIVNLSYKGNSGLMSSSKFSIEKNVINFIYTNGDLKESMEICNKDSDSCLYWNIFPENGKRLLNIENYDNLFRLNYSKMIIGKNKIYYVLLSYMSCFLFVKIIWAGDIKLIPTKAYQFIEVFNKNSQIMEIYMLTEE